ncbi:MAG: hypothetical protein K2M69_01660 [Muribaculaceae bacterium]|nr:hypothetical protein [Muribaculaceae bacterium]
MKKTFYSKGFLANALTLLLSVALLPSCSDKDEPDNGSKNPDPVAVNYGTYVLNQGQDYAQVEGSLTYINPVDNFSVENNVFVNVNKRSLGSTPQCGVRYGSKVYLGICDSSTIEIIDATSFKSLKQIKLDAATTGSSPRGMATDNGKVYVTMFDGYVARLDTASLEIDGRVQVGPNPEIPAVFNGKLFVPNSDGLNYAVGYGETASIINLATFTVESTVKVPLNPNKFLATDNNLYLLTKGNYRDIDGAIYEIDPSIANLQKEDNGDGYKFIAEATSFAAYEDALVYLNTPYTNSTLRYYAKYDIKSGNITTWNAPEVIYPNELNVDPFSGDIYVASYYMDGPYPSYILPGFVAIYDKNFTFKKKCEVGSGPSCIFF